MRGHLPILIALGAITESLPAQSHQASLPPSPLQVDRPDYTAVCIEGSGIPCRYRFTLVASYENETADTLYLDRCTPRNHGPMYGIEAVDDTADAAYDPAWGCVGGVSPIVIAPHTTRVDTLRIEGPNQFDGHTHAPMGKLEGAFRLLYDVGSCRPGRTTCQLRSVPQRSGTFRVHAVGSVTTGQLPQPRCAVRGPHSWLASRPSPLDSTIVDVGGRLVKICYSRPSLHGRSVDSLVPRGRAWRVGANEPTTLTLSATLRVGGAVLVPGRYVILAVPDTAEWRLVFNTTPDTEATKMFNSLEEIAIGLGRVERNTEWTEQFTIGTASVGTSLLLEWGYWRIRVPLDTVPS